MTSEHEISIGKSVIGINRPTYFIADIAASHDGSLDRAIELINLAKDAGADAAKFQHFTADTIVSDIGFKKLGGQQSHQASWGKSVYEVYKDASVDNSWTSILKATCDEVGIDFFTSPYSLEIVDEVDPYVEAYKIGSGDITWIQIIEHMLTKGKPLILASGASDLRDVMLAMDVISAKTKDVVLLQCNTNYTASLDNFKDINLNVLKTYRAMYPELILGLSDHTPGHATVLGAVALGASVIEKHLTDDQSRDGPDHKFSMSPVEWRDMVDRTRELELALGSGIKRVEENETETVMLQRRSIRLKRDIATGETLQSSDLEVLRPSPKQAFSPAELNLVLGKKVNRDIEKGDVVSWLDLS